MNKDCVASGDLQELEYLRGIIDRIKRDSFALLAVRRALNAPLSEGELDALKRRPKHPRKGLTGYGHGYNAGYRAGHLAGMREKE